MLLDDGLGDRGDPDDDALPSRRAARPAPAPEPEPAWRQLLAGRWSVHPAAALALLVLVAAVVAVLVVRAATAAPPAPAPSPGVAVPARTPAPAAAASGAPSAGGAAAGSAAGSAASGPAGPAAASGAASAPAAAAVVVDVAGQVVRPGLVHLPAGSRVDDAVRAAGGPSGEADLRRLNLARVLVDGEQVLVPAPGEALPAPAPVAGAASSGAAAGGAAAGGAAGAAAGPVHLNTATLAELDALPGVGPVLAQRVLDWRAAHGAFTAVDELGEVSGIGPATLERLRPLVAV